MSTSSLFLTGVAKRVAAAYVARTDPRAILLTGSVAEGTSDEFSDIDLIVYHETRPVDDGLALVRAELQVSEPRMMSGQEMESFVEQFVLDGVTCQVAHTTLAAWERNMAVVLDEYEPATVIEKALSGLLSGVALHGENLIGVWQARAADYPEALAVPTVEHYLQFFPLWVIAESLPARDATIFYHQMLVEASTNLLGVLAGVNRVYFSSFQFKRLGQFSARLSATPEDFAARLETLFRLDPVAGAVALERLVVETIDLVEAAMPEIDTSGARGTLGKRHRPWHAAGAPMA